jgi:BON domain
MPVRGYEFLIAPPPSRRNWRGVGLVCLSGLLLALSGSDNILSGANPKEDDPPARKSNRPTLNELEVTIRARQALLDDPRFQSLNLFLTVQDGTATLSGPVPSEDLGRQAVAILNNVPGVYQVRNKLNVVKARGEQQLFIPLRNDPPTQTQSASPAWNPGALGPPNPPAPQGTLAGRTTKNPPVPATEGGVSPFPNTGVTPAPAPTTSGHEPPLGGVIMLSPIAIPETAPRARETQPVVNPIEELRVGVEQVRRLDRRFRPLLVEIHDTQTLWVYDDPWRGEDVASFVESLRKLPGVRSVVIKNKG